MLEPSASTPKPFAAQCTRVYTRTGKKAHLLPPFTSPNTHGAALCGTGPEWFEVWRGTGSQSETETAASLSLCRYCEKRATAEDEAAACNARRTMTRTPKTSAEATPPAVRATGQSSPPLPEAPRKAAAGRPPSAVQSQPRDSARAGLVTAADPHPAGAVPERSSTAPGGCQLPADAPGADAGEARDPGRAVSQPAARPGQGDAAAARKGQRDTWKRAQSARNADLRRGRTRRAPRQPGVGSGRVWPGGKPPEGDGAV